ncbi:MAG: DUF6588 family protein [bacterium]
MKRLLPIVLVIGFFATFTARQARAQYFKFEKLPPAQINSEVDAILKYFGSLVGGGLYHTAKLHHVGGLDVGVRGVVARVPDKFQDLPVFSQEDLLGLAFLHASLGLPGNFELIGRFFYLPIGSSRDINAKPSRAQDSRGGVTLVGGGLKYGLLQLPGLPKIMVMATYHAVFVPSEFDFGTVSSANFNAVVSHSLPLLTVYAGGGVDITRLKLNDEFLGGDTFTETEPHLTLGANVNILPLVHVNGSYNFSEFSSFDLGIGLSFR